jgi:hypothetical protein
MVLLNWEMPLLDTVISIFLWILSALPVSQTLGCFFFVSSDLSGLINFIRFLKLISYLESLAPFHKFCIPKVCHNIKLYNLASLTVDKGVKWYDWNEGTLISHGENIKFFLPSSHYWTILSEGFWVVFFLHKLLETCYKSILMKHLLSDYGHVSSASSPRKVVVSLIMIHLAFTSLSYFTFHLAL